MKTLIIELTDTIIDLKNIVFFQFQVFKFIYSIKFSWYLV